MRTKALLLGAFLVLWAGPAYAVFAGTATTNASFQTATLQPPTNLAAVPGCTGGGPTQGTVALSWTPSSSSFAQSYTVVRSYAGVPNDNTTTVTPASVSTLAQTGLRRGRTYTWTFRTNAGSWISAPVGVSATMPSPPCP